LKKKKNLGKDEIKESEKKEKDDLVTFISNIISNVESMCSEKKKRQTNNQQNQNQNQIQTEPFEHPAICDCCQNKLIGNRHKCKICPDYDLCDKCLKINSQQPFHSHSFQLINTKEYYVEQKKSFCQFFQQNQSDQLVHPAICDCCQNKLIGNRHKCKICPDYDLCDKCFKINSQQPFHSHAFQLINTKEYYVEQRKATETQSQTEIKKESPNSEIEMLKSPKIESPKVESPKVESPKVESPKIESPKVEQKPKVNSDYPIVQFQEKLDKLNEMGFTDRQKNIDILIEKDGDLLNTVRALLM